MGICILPFSHTIQYIWLNYCKIIFSISTVPLVPLMVGLSIILSMTFGTKLVSYCITRLSTVTVPLLIVREVIVVFDDWVVNVESQPPERVRSLDVFNVRSSA